MSDVTTVHQFALDMLAALEVATATTTDGTPDRSFVSPSLPSLDCCPQLTVHVQSMGLENTNPLGPTLPGQRVKLGSENLLVLVGIIARCSPQVDGVNFPDPAEITALASQTSQDLFASWQKLKTAIDDGTLFSGRCYSTYVDPAVPLTDQGGCAGWILTVRTVIEGYEVP